MDRLNKVLVVSLGCLFVACSSFAALIRPNLKNKSARLDALQLNVGVEDETNVIGLDLWAGNPAGLVSDEKKSRVVPVLEHDRMKDANSDVTKSWLPGVYGVYKMDNQAFAFQGNYQKLNSDTLNTDEKQMFGSATYSAMPSKFFSLGGTLGYQKDTAEDDITAKTTSKSDPLYWTIGGALLAPGENGDFSIGVQYISNDSKTTANGFSDETLTDYAKNFSTIYRSKRVDAGLTYVDETIEQNDGVKESNYLVSGRFFLRPETPWVLGASASYASEVEGLLGSNQSTMDVEAGATWLFEKQGLIGVNYTRNHSIFDGGSESPEGISVGGEMQLTDIVTGRASYKYGSTDVNGALTTTAISNAFGAGFGFKLTELAKLDLTWLHGTETDHSKTIDTTTDVLEVVGTMYFQ